MLRLPDSLSFEQGAAIPVNYATAYAGFVMMGGLRKGDRALIHAAAGGVGIAATQVAKDIGAEIFGTASASKHDAIRAQGVDHAIDYRSTDFAEEVMRITNGEGVDVVMDAIGPSSFKSSYSVLRQGGRLIMFGLSEVQTGEKRDLPAVVKGLVRMPMATFPWWKSLSVMNENKGIFGLNMLSWWDREGLDRALEPLPRALSPAPTCRSSPRLSRSTTRPPPTATSARARTSARSFSSPSAVNWVELASISSLYERTIHDTGREPEFIFLAAFLLTFSFIRTSAHMINAGVSWWPGNVNVGGTHIHHLVWGI